MFKKKIYFQNNSKEEAPKPPSPVNAPLPNGLSEDIIKLVDSLKEVSAQSNEGKFKFFNAEVNQIILEYVLNLFILTSILFLFFKLKNNLVHKEKENVSILLK